MPLSGIALSLIEEAMKLSKPVDAHAATRATSRAHPELGMGNVRIHELRRTVASQMAVLEATTTIGLGRAVADRMRAYARPA